MELHLHINAIFLFQQEENNNNIPNSNNEHPANSSTSQQKSAQVTVEMRSLKFTIAAANPLLAEKLAQPTGQLQQLSSPSSNNRPQLAPLVPKVEKGKLQPLQHRCRWSINKSRF